RGEHRSPECLLRNRDPGRDQHGSNGDAAAAADPCVPRAVVPHAAHSGADAEPATHPQPGPGALKDGALNLNGNWRSRNIRPIAPVSYDGAFVEIAMRTGTLAAAVSMCLLLRVQG